LAISLRTPRARSHLQYIFIGATVLAAFVAVVPIVAAVVAGGSPASLAKTAFATAPAGQYAVVSRPEEKEDVIAIAPADGGTPVEVARIAHLPGFAATGAVSPDGRRLAVVTVDDGSAARPQASLLVVDLESASTRRIGSSLDQLQTPTWSPDGRSLVVSRTTEEANGRQTVRFFRVAADGSGSAKLYDVQGVLGAYAVGFEPGGALIGVTIDGRGSHATRDGAEVTNFSTQITRDWRLSPDGSQLAFVEANLANGLRYIARTVSLDGSTSGSVEAQTAGAGQQLGAAWRPGSPAATFGKEPPGSTRSSEIGSSESGSVEAQAIVGFDVPLAYSPDGSALAVTHWSGQSFKDPGDAALELVASSGRTAVASFSRFFGWASR
jgi:hypothetical protein